MNDTLLNHSTIFQGSSQLHTSINWWMWLSIVEFGIILFYLKKNSKNKNTSAKSTFRKEALKNEVDFGNIIDSSFNSRQLYDILKVKCHPDRFPNDPLKIEIANSIFMEISKNKTNINRLKELKEEAIQKLNIKL